MTYLRIFWGFLFPLHGVLGDLDLHGLSGHIGGHLGGHLGLLGGHGGGGGYGGDAHSLHGLSFAHHNFINFTALAEIKCAQMGGVCEAVMDCDTTLNIYLGTCGFDKARVCCIPRELVCQWKGGTCVENSEAGRDECLSSGAFFSWFICDGVMRCCLPTKHGSIGGLNGVLQSLQAHRQALGLPTSHFGHFANKGGGYGGGGGGGHKHGILGLIGRKK